MEEDIFPLSTDIDIQREIEEPYLNTDEEIQEIRDQWAKIDEMRAKQSDQ